MRRTIKLKKTWKLTEAEVDIFCAHPPSPKMGARGGFFPGFVVFFTIYG